MMHGGDVWRGGAPEDWLDFSANIRPEGPPDWVKRALLSAMDEVRYYPEPGLRAARAGLAAFLGLDPEYVLPTPGGVAALAAGLRVGIRGALIPTPCFTEYARLAQSVGLPVRTVPLGALRGAVERLPEGWLVCAGNPVNPLGRAFGAGEVEELLEAVRRRDGWLLLDEAFVGYCPGRSAARRVSDGGRLLVAGSMTKLLGIPGARLGYLCAGRDVIAGLAREQLPWALNCFAAAVARALPDHIGEIGVEAPLNAARRERMRAALKALGARVYPSEAPFLLVRLDGEAAPVAARLRARGILVRECMDFEGIDDGRHLRLAVKGEDAVARLARELREALACAENR